MGIEPITYHLQGGCSTIELRRRPLDMLLLICVKTNKYIKISMLTQAWFFNQSRFARCESIRCKGKSQDILRPNCEGVSFVRRLAFANQIDRFDCSEIVQKIDLSFGQGITEFFPLFPS